MISFFKGYNIYVCVFPEILEYPNFFSPVREHKTLRFWHPKNPT